MPINCTGKELALLSLTHSRVLSGRNATRPERSVEIERKSSVHDRQICDRQISLETNQQKAFCTVDKLETP